LPRCGYTITPAEITRVNWEEIECPACRVRFDPAKITASQTDRGECSVGREDHGED